MPNFSLKSMFAAVIFISVYLASVANGWIPLLLCCLVLISIAGAGIARPDGVGYVAGAVFSMFIVVPATAIYAISQLLPPNHAIDWTWILPPLACLTSGWFFGWTVRQTPTK